MSSCSMKKKIIGVLPNHQGSVCDLSDVTIEAERVRE